MHNGCKPGMSGLTHATFNPNADMTCVCVNERQQNLKRIAFLFRASTKAVQQFLIITIKILLVLRNSGSTNSLASTGGRCLSCASAWTIRVLSLIENKLQKRQDGQNIACWSWAKKSTPTLSDCALSDEVTTDMSLRNSTRNQASATLTISSRKVVQMNWQGEVG